MSGARIIQGLEEAEHHAIDSRARAEERAAVLAWLERYSMNARSLRDQSSIVSGEWQRLESIAHQADIAHGAIARGEHVSESRTAPADARLS